MAISLADFMLASGDAAGGGAIGAVTVCEEAAARCTSEADVLGNKLWVKGYGKFASLSPVSGFTASICVSRLFK